MKQSLGGTVAAAYGYRTANPAHQMIEYETPALNSYAKTRSTELATGKAVYTVIRDATADPNAGAALITATLCTIATSLRATAGMNDLGEFGIDDLGLPDEVADVELGVNPRVEQKRQAAELQTQIMKAASRNSVAMTTATRTRMTRTGPCRLSELVPAGYDVALELEHVCMVITYSRVWINRIRLPILLVVS